MIRYFGFLVAGLLALSTASAHDPRPPHGRYVIETWNSGSRFNPFSIYTIGQTPDGYLWLATDGGLVRFDGHDFMEFTTRNTPILTSNDVTGMTVTPGGDLWIGTWDGGILRLSGGELKSAHPPDDPVRNSEVYALHVAADGRFWMGDRRGLSTISNDSVSRYALPEGLAHEVFSIIDGPDSSILFSLGSRVARLDRNDSIEVLTKLPGASAALALLSNRDGGLLIGSNIGLFELRGERLSRVAGMPESWVQALHRDRSGVLWVVTVEDGIYRCENGVFEHLTTDQGLPGDRIRAVFEDRDGNLWFGTRGAGFFRLKDPLITVIHPAEGGVSGRISTVLELKDGLLAVGTRDAGLSIIRGEARTVIDARSGLSSPFIRCTFEDSRGDLWIGTTDETYRMAANDLREGTGRPRRVRRGMGALPNVRSIIEDGEGNVWLGSHGYGVFRVDRSTGAIEEVSPLRRDYLALVRVLFRRMDGSVLVGTKGGLYAVGDTGAVVPPAWRTAGISEVFSMYEDADSTLWVGTYGQGLFRIRKERITRYTVSDGLFNNVVFSIIEDHSGRLWMTCNMGIFYADKSDLEAFSEGTTREVRCISFGVRDGMLSEECNGGSAPPAWKAADGRLMFATMDGVAAIDPSRLTSDTSIPPVLFETVVVDGSPMPASAPLDLAHDTKKIEFDYTAIGYRRAGDIEFRAFLEGFDEGWSERGTRRSVSYTSLPPGDYVIRVAARYHDTAWPDSSASIAFTIPPAFLDRWSVRIVLAVCLAGAAFGFVKRRERRIRAVAEREREVRSRISELESRALRSQINPHFMFNSLNGIREAVLGGRMKVAADYLDKFSLLVRNVLEHSDRATVSLEREIETIRLYVELEQLRFEEPFRFSIAVPESLDAASVAIPPMLIQPIVENAIWHGLGPKRGDKLLSITFSGDERRVTCLVEDNGVGRSAAIVRKSLKSGDRRARGMQITRDLLEALRASTGEAAGIDVVDLYNADGSAAGTRVTLTIPTQP